LGDMMVGEGRERRYGKLVSRSEGGVYRGIII
jgi:hypothetical protein